MEQLVTNFPGNYGYCAPSIILDGGYHHPFLGIKRKLMRVFESASSLDEERIVEVNFWRCNEVNLIVL
jgi:hypothetical protein